MDRSRLTSSQSTVIDTLPGPLFVAAGAGSGKTHTLKLRTANAFLDNDSGFKLDSIDQVLAITFTEKAAAELLSRIKGALLDEGLDQQAFDADTAWISTIHGFCNRFLKETALEIGLDPDFKLASGLEAKVLEEQAKQDVLSAINEGALDLSGLSWNWDVIPASEHGSGLLDDAQAISSKAHAVPDSFGAFKHLASDLVPKALVQELVRLGLLVSELPASWKSVHATWERPKLDRLAVAISKAQQWLTSSQADLGFDSPQFNSREFRNLLLQFPMLTKGFGKNKPGQEEMDAYREALVVGLYETDGIFSMQASSAALEIAKMLDERRRQISRSAGLLTNDDLLQLTLNALRDHPDIAQRYRARFKLIMVDEFQDTDKVQIEIVRHIAQPGFANVCVVGDAQQSIYRFRGADVSAFDEYRDELVALHPQAAEGSALEPKLKQNFRSHADILAFVDAIFMKDGSFGKSYLQLEPQGGINDEPDPVMDARPRVQLDLIHYATGDGIKRGPDAVRESARRIAQHFLELKEAYKALANGKPHTYALLLGKTKNAQAYIDALREVGLEAMMTSGSTLMASDEAALVMALLRYAVNAFDERALLECLTSDLFAISDDVLLALSYYEAEGSLHHGSLAKGFLAPGLPFGILEASADAAALDEARSLMGEFRKRAEAGRPSEAIRHLLSRSGFLDRAQSAGVSGLASVGNLSILLNMVKGAEEEHPGLSEMVASYAATVDTAKESPGVLAVQDADFVQIMTVHGSKGLQFDHVALADIKTGADPAKGMMAENESGTTFAGSKAGLSKEDALKDYAAECERMSVQHLRDAKTPGQLLLKLESVSKEEGLAEARRLLYVGLTRAVRSLYVSYVTHMNPAAKGAEPYASQGVMAEVYQALEWDISAKELQESYDYGGSRPAVVRLERFEGAPHEDEPVVQEASGSFLVPIRNIPDEPALARFRGVRSDVRSYSSLSHDAEPEEVEVAEEGAQDASSILEREPGEDPTALGTAFHRLAQLAILKREPGEALSCPDDAAVRAQEVGLGLSEAQKERLARALGGWFGSPEAAELASHQDVQAEVPFMVRIDAPDGQARYLEGEIDALAASGTAAFLIDYKTGGSASESEEALHEKHLLQAQCYAYALLRNGCSSVDAVFVRVEQLDAAGHPQTVRYSFVLDDLPALESAILTRWS
ncbi:MAG: UvrD-helicase domain-containing protein [Eggerthellaceae bacterium]|nr:UvrD-helicase domain-containing protein [Eggerthellaceae bacterium]